MRVDGTEFDHLDVMLQNLQSFLFRCGIRQFPNVLPCLQKRAGLFADPYDERLPLGNVGKRLLQQAFFRLKPLQFSLNPGQPL